MPKLILTVEDKFLDEFAIDKDTITIGRRTDNDICLDNLAISGYHTQITTVLNDSFLEDLSSTNGTFVNSKIIKKHALKDGDIIDIGNHRIKYINHLATSSANSEFEQTVVMQPRAKQNNIDESIADLVSQMDAIADGKSASDGNPIDDKDAAANENTPAPVESKAPESVDPETIDDESLASIEDLPIETAATNNKIGRIQILNGSNSGKELTLDKSLTTVGKPNVAVVGITKRNSGYYIIHVEGSEDSASKLNGELIAGKAQPLEDHDIIDVAGIKLEFFVE